MHQPRLEVLPLLRNEQVVAVLSMAAPPHTSSKGLRHGLIFMACSFIITLSSTQVTAPLAVCMTSLSLTRTARVATLRDKATPGCKVQVLYLLTWVVRET